jgi:hypothetical protein
VILLSERACSGMHMHASKYVSVKRLGACLQDGTEAAGYPVNLSCLRGKSG